MHKEGLHASSGCDKELTFVASLFGASWSCITDLSALCRHKYVPMALQGHPAQDYTAKTDSGSLSEACTALQQKMDALLGLHSAREGGAWMECCIKTYFTDRKRPLDTCQFRLFGTRLR